MPLLKIRKYGDPILRQKCQEVEKIDHEVQKLIDSMIKTMQKNKGIGLAAPQVGIKKRIIVVNVDTGPMALVNPKIVETRGEDILEEGCLSLPDIFINVKRPEGVVVEGQNREGKKIKIEASFLAAHALQHEIEHLDGILIIDKVSFWQKWKLGRKLKEIKKD